MGEGEIPEARLLTQGEKSLVGERGRKRIKRKKPLRAFLIGGVQKSRGSIVSNPGSRARLEEEKRLKKEAEQTKRHCRDEGLGKGGIPSAISNSEEIMSQEKRILALLRLGGPIDEKET